MTNSAIGQFQREAEFHDRWAAETLPTKVQVAAAFEAITAPEGRLILQLLGDLNGRRILDIGCGLGESAIYFAKAGADVTAVDISPEMIDLCLRNATAHGVEIRGVVSPGENLEVEPGYYDIVHAANVIHHAQDRETLLRNAHAALKPGGQFVAWDPIAYNPLINIYRRIATKVRTEDESPLCRRDLELSRKYFPDLQYRTTWLATLSLFLKYYLINRYSPNEVRYWKRILEETPQTIGWWFKPLSGLDRILLRLPGVRWLGWNIIQWGRKSMPTAQRPERSEQDLRRRIKRLPR